jgi:hypothetical protein
MTRTVLAAAHLDSDPTNNRLRNLRALCQRCHILHDRPQHLAQRWITYRRRLAAGDLFLGPYPALIAELTSNGATAAESERAVSLFVIPAPGIPHVFSPAARARRKLPTPSEARLPSRRQSHRRRERNSGQSR